MVIPVKFQYSKLYYTFNDNTTQLHLFTKKYHLKFNSRNMQTLHTLANVEFTLFFHIHVCFTFFSSRIYYAECKNNKKREEVLYVIFCGNAAFVVYVCKDMFCKCSFSEESNWWCDERMKHYVCTWHEFYAVSYCLT